VSPRARRFPATWYRVASPQLGTWQPIRDLESGPEFARPSNWARLTITSWRAVVSYGGSQTLGDARDNRSQRSTAQVSRNGNDTEPAARCWLYKSYATQWQPDSPTDQRPFGHRRERRSWHERSSRHKRELDGRCTGRNSPWQRSGRTSAATARQSHPGRQSPSASNTAFQGRPKRCYERIERLRRQLRPADRLVDGRSQQLRHGDRNRERDGHTLLHMGATSMAIKRRRWDRKRSLGFGIRQPDRAPRATLLRRHHWGRLGGVQRAERCSRVLRSSWRGE
jgi:hypothetical protein